MKNTAQTIIITLFTLIFSINAMAEGPKSSVDFNTAVRDAKNIAAMNTNWDVYQASGKSMNPQFGDSSLLLVEKANINEVKAGMIALYVDAEGDVVAHKILSNSENGLVAKGINNPSVDPITVTETNLIGVVFGMLHASEAGNSDLPVAMGKSY